MFVIIHKGEIPALLLKGNSAMADQIGQRLGNYHLLRLLGRRDDILLSDFGIAVVAHSSRSQSTQEIIGTVSYMAPEQIQGRPRPASDQYALGVVAYEWLCGCPPFHGTPAEITSQHLHAEPPSLREQVPGILPAIEARIGHAAQSDIS